MAVLSWWSDLTLWIEKDRIGFSDGGFVTHRNTLKVQELLETTATASTTHCSRH